MEPINGNESASVAKTQLDTLLDTIVHFGDAWRLEHYQNGPGGALSIAVLYPPDRPGMAIAAPMFYSQILLMTSRGQLPIPFQIPATSLEEATSLWRQYAQKAVRDFDKQQQENQRRIVLPGSEPPNAPFPRRH